MIEEPPLDRPNNVGVYARKPPGNGFWVPLPGNGFTRALLRAFLWLASAAALAWIGALAYEIDLKLGKITAGIEANARAVAAVAERVESNEEVVDDLVDQLNVRTDSRWTLVDQQLWARDLRAAADHAVPEPVHQPLSGERSVDERRRARRAAQGGQP